jgi:hypothetical protein
LKFWLFGVVALLAACTTSSTLTLSAEDNQAILAAEAFVTRHGFTDVPHPSDQPVLMVELFDILATSREELLGKRHNAIQAEAFALEQIDEDTYYVLFRGTRDRNEVWSILVNSGEATRVLHAPRLNKARWRKVPPNNHMQRAGSP